MTCYSRQLGRSTGELHPNNAIHPLTQSPPKPSRVYLLPSITPSTALPPPKPPHLLNQQSTVPTSIPSPTTINLTRQSWNFPLAPPLNPSLAQSRPRKPLLPAATNQQRTHPPCSAQLPAELHCWLQYSEDEKLLHTRITCTGKLSSTQQQRRYHSPPPHPQPRPPSWKTSPSPSSQAKLNHKAPTSPLLLPLGQSLPTLTCETATSPPHQRKA